MTEVPGGDRDLVEQFSTTVKASRALRNSRSSFSDELGWQPTHLGQGQRASGPPNRLLRGGARATRNSRTARCSLWSLG